jgi:hypothetical protein
MSRQERASGIGMERRRGPSLGYRRRSMRPSAIPGVHKTNVNLESAQIIAYFVRRWQIKVTFSETRAHLSVENSTAVE